MFVTTRFMMNDGDASAAPETGGEPAGSTVGSGSVDGVNDNSDSNSSEVNSIDDIFDKAAEHIENNWEDPRPDHNEVDNPFEDDEDDGFSDEDDSEDKDNKEVNKEGTPREEDDQEEDFKPYTFKATVNGEEVERTFNSKEDLDRALARAEFAPKLYNQVRKMESEMAPLREDAEFGNDVLAMAENDPKSLLDILDQDLIRQDVMSSWVYDKYQDYSKLAKMTPQEQQTYAMQREAEKIIENDRYRRQQDEDRRKRDEQTRIENETKQFNTWLQREESKWIKDVPPEYRRNVATAIRTVVGYARRELDANKRVTFKEMSGMIHDILAPYKSSRSPAANEREVAKAVENKKSRATAAVQRAARNASGQRPAQSGSKGRKAYTVEDIFNGAEAAIRTGRSKLRE